MGQNQNQSFRPLKWVLAVAFGLVAVAAGRSFFKNDAQTSPPISRTVAQATPATDSAAGETAPEVGPTDAVPSALEVEAIDAGTSDSVNASSEIQTTEALNPMPKKQPLEKTKVVNSNSYLPSAKVEAEVVQKPNPKNEPPMVYEKPSTPSLAPTTEKVQNVIVPAQPVKAVLTCEPAPAAMQNPEFWLWLGTGMNYQSYQQTIPSVNGKVKYQELQGPTLYTRAGFQGESLGLDVSYRESSGHMASSPVVQVSHGKYRWKTLTTEGLYRLNPSTNLRFGLQHHMMPFMDLDAMTSIVDVKSNTLTMATLGFDKQFKMSKKLRTEWMMRYQHPMFVGTRDGTPFKVMPRIAFDGSLGGIYNLDEKSRLGLFWYGQWHDYSFSYGRNTNRFSGNQILFYTSIELRLGFEF